MRSNTDFSMYFSNVKVLNRILVLLNFTSLLFLIINALCISLTRMFLIGILVLYFTLLLLLIINDNDYWTTNSQTMPLALLLRNCELTRSENMHKVPFSSESPLRVNLWVVSSESCNRNTYCGFEAYDSDNKIRSWWITG